MNLGKLISVDRGGVGFTMTIDVPGRSEYVVLVFDEDEAVEHVVTVLGHLNQPARERALDRGQRELDVFVVDRICASLRQPPAVPPGNRRSPDQNFRPLGETRPGVIGTSSKYAPDD